MFSPLAFLSACNFSLRHRPSEELTFEEGKALIYEASDLYDYLVPKYRSDVPYAIAFSGMLLWQIFKMDPFWILVWTGFASYMDREVLYGNRHTKMLIKSLYLHENGDKVILRFSNELKTVKIEDIQQGGVLTGVNLYAYRSFPGEFTKINDGVRVYLLDNFGKYYHQDVVEAISSGKSIDTSEED